MKIAKIKNLGKMFVDSNWEMARAQTVWSKEPETIAWIDTFSPNAYFWDIGANIGIYSLYCAKTHKNVTIQAFEPMKANFLRLWQNILLNDYISITAHYMAMNDFSSRVFFNSKNKDAGSSGGKLGGFGYPIAAVSIDCMVLTGLDIPNYIKIDTDSNEYDILMGGVRTLNNSKCKSVLVEINDCRDKIMALMFDSGFTVDDKLMEKKDRESDHNFIFTRK